MKVEKFSSVTASELPSYGVPDVSALGKDFSTSHTGEAPITFGVFRMNSGESLVYSYEFDEFKLVLEGEITVTDDQGVSEEFRAGDVMQFRKGTTVSFSSASTGLAFYVAQR